MMNEAERRLEKIESEIKDWELPKESLKFKALMIEQQGILFGINATRADLQKRFDEAVLAFKKEANDLADQALARVEIIGIGREGLLLFIRQTVELLQQVKTLEDKVATARKVLS